MRTIMGKNKTAGQAETPATQPVAVRNGDSPRTAYRRWRQASLSRTIRCYRVIVVISAVALFGCSAEKPGGPNHMEKDGTVQVKIETTPAKK
ncbi:hypothetical protein [Candidatus Thiodictyon syntrophicum]|jgi:hypothetical protein|uniref:hypothetical protein n=1 Tax=Candidatus Thiodictyon syntrophicum TaxID=1166950 RepID=UPI0012FD1B7D|nr:hypothetical protein [Candidatus Thiodictyon syntrophicum]